jgi:hypothetical protein
MTRTWTVCRQYSPRQDGERRWDQAYQLLARRARQGGLPSTASGSIGGNLFHQRNPGTAGGAEQLPTKSSWVSCQPSLDGHSLSNV